MTRRVLGRDTGTTHSGERPGLHERLARLAGVTTYRVPVEGVGTRVRQLPPEHELAAAIGMARRKDDPLDIGPDVLFDLVTSSARHQRQACAVLANALDKLRREHRAVNRCRPYLRIVAHAAYLRIVFDQDARQPEGMSRADWLDLTDAAERILETMAGDALSRTAAALRKAKAA